MEKYLSVMEKHFFDLKNNDGGSAYDFELTNKNWRFIKNEKLFPELYSQS